MDKKEAHKLLGRFQHCAYQLSKLEEFQNATRLLYGEVWVVKPDIVQRMTFDCTACHKVMNSVVAVKEHTFSEAHMKVLDNIKQKMYKRSLSWSQVITLKDLLQNSYVQAVGLQMIEEYKTGKKIYYKCILCGAHSDVESMYNHVIGAKHTERYIEMRDERKSIPFMTTKVREECRDMIVKEEGVCLNDMKTIIGADYYPYMWEKNNRIRYRTSTRNSTPMSSMTNLTLSCSSLYESEATNLPKREVSILPKTEACTLPKPLKSSRSPDRTYEDCETRMINKAMECRSPGRSSEAGALETKSKKKKSASIFKLPDQIEQSEAINLLKREVSILPKTEACTLPKPSKSSRSPERTFEDCETRMINKAMECRPPGRSSEAGALETKSEDKKKYAASVFKLADQIEHMFL